MADLFFSYSRTDFDLAARLRGLLLDRRLSVWMDTEEMQVGQDWMRRIEAEIDRAEGVLWLMTPASLQSEVCADEVAWAVEAGKRIIPVAIEGVGHADFPEAVSHLHAIWINPSPEADVGSAVDEVVASANADPEWTALHGRLLVAARAWDAGGRKPLSMLSGSDIDGAETALTEEHAPADPQPTELLHSFVVASRLHQSTRRRRVLFATVVLLAIAGVATVFALGQRGAAEVALSRADEQEQVAEEQQAVADEERSRADVEARRVAARAMSETALGLVETDAEAATALVTAAWELSPDDETRFGMVATAAALGDIRAFNAPGLEAVEFSVELHDGVALVAGDTVHSVISGDLGAVRSVTVETNEAGIAPAVVDVTPDGSYAIVAWEDPSADFNEPFEVGVASLETGSRLWSEQATLSERLLPFDDGERALLLRNPTGLDTTGEIRRLSDGVVISTGGTPLFPPYDVVIAADGLFFTGGSGVRREDADLALWSTDGRLDVFRPGPPENASFSYDAEGIYNVRSVDYLASPVVYAAGHSDGSVTIVTDQATVDGFGGHDSGVTDIAINPGGTEVVTVGDDGSLAFWSVATGELLQRSSPASGQSGSSIDYLSDDTVIIVTEGGLFVRSVGGGAAALTSVTPAPQGLMSPDGSMVGNVGDESIEILSLDDASHLAMAAEVVISSSGGVGWDGDTLTVVATGPNPEQVTFGLLDVGGSDITWTRDVSLTPSASSTVAGPIYLTGDLQEVTAHSIRTGQAVAALKWDSIGPWLGRASTSPLGGYIAAWAVFDGGGQLRLFQTADPPGREVPIDAWAPIDWAFAPDDSALATVTPLRGVRLLALGSDNPVDNPLSDRTDIRSIAFFPDGSMLVGVADDEVVIWDIINRRQLATIPLDLNTTRPQLAVLDDNATIVVHDGVRKHHVSTDPEEVQRALCDLSPAKLTPEQWRRFAGAIEPVDGCP